MFYRNLSELRADGLKSSYFILLCLGLLILRLFGSGYRFAKSDLAVHIPLIWYYQDKSLFEGDLLAKYADSYYSLFFQIFALFKFDIKSLQIAFFILYCVFNFVFIYFFLKICHLLILDFKLSLLCGIIFCLGLYQPQFALGDIINFFSYRTIAISLTTAAFYFFLKDKYFLSFLLSGISCNFHAPLGFMCAGIFAIYLFFFWRDKFLKKILFLILFFITNIFILIKRVSNLGSFELLPSKEWAEIINLRMGNFFFLFEVPLKEIIEFLLFFLIFSVALKRAQIEIQLKRKIFITTLCVVFFILSVGIHSDLLKIPFFMQVCFLRSSFFLYLIGLPLITLYFSKNKHILPFALSSLAISNNLLIFLCFLFSFFKNKVLNFIFCCILFVLFLLERKYFIGILFSFLIPYSISQFKLNKKFFLLFFIFLLLVVGLKNKNYFFYRKPPESWIEVCIWAKENTNKKDLFIVPLYTMGFKVYSQRGCVFDVKDGHIVLFNKKAAFEWLQRLNEFSYDIKSLDYYTLKKIYDNLSVDKILKIAKKYDAKYIITSKKGCIYPFELVFENQEYRIYKIR